MSLIKKINPFLTTNNDTGFGVNADSYGGRFINRDGSFNMRKEGLSFLKRFSIYHNMLTMPRWKFISFLVVTYLSINLIYAIIYLLIGLDQLQGVIATSFWGKFKEAYFFSTETFTTVGYGRVNPIGDGANFIAAIESFNGFLSFALATGLIFGRFSRPRSYLLFSEHAFISPYKDIKALMFRFAPFKDKHILTDVNIKVNIGLLQVQENGTPEYRYYDLELERTRIDSLAMNWTAVHPINENSPIQGFSEDDLKTADVEIYVLIRGFDEIYSSIVQRRTSYTYQEIKFGRKFIPMYRESEDGRTTILELHKLNEYIDV